LGCRVREEDQSRRRVTPERLDAKFVRDQAGLHGRPKAPAQHLTAEQVHHGSQEKSALAQGSAGVVDVPDPIGCCQRSTGQQALSIRQIVFAVGSDDDDHLLRALMPRMCINRCSWALPT